eukprot:279653-Prorocentrum_minimum.AAC.2
MTIPRGLRPPSPSLAAVVSHQMVSMPPARLPPPPSDDIRGDRSCPPTAGYGIPGGLLVTSVT